MRAVLLAGAAEALGRGRGRGGLGEGGGRAVEHGPEKERRDWRTGVFGIEKACIIHPLFLNYVLWKLLSLLQCPYVRVQGKCNNFVKIQGE